MEANVIEKLKQPLDKEKIAWRKESWKSDTQIPYLKAHFVIDQANEVFGHDGWECDIVELKEISKRDVEKDGRKGWEIGYQAIVRIRIKNGDEYLCRDDVGYGTGVDYSSLASAYESAGKEAVSDGLKRVLRTFGDQFGNCLYDKEYRAELGQPSGGQQSQQRSYGGNPSGKPMTGAASPAQIKFLNKLVSEKGIDLKELLPEGTTVDKLSKQEASAIIDKLNKE